MKTKFVPCPQENDGILVEINPYQNLCIVEQYLSYIFTYKKNVIHTSQYSHNSKIQTYLHHHISRR